MHVVPCRPGQTVNVGACTPATDVTPAFTATPELGALILHTQTANVATAPGLTREVAEKDWTCTHSCGFFGFGAGELFVGLGFGLGDAEVGLGDGLGLELGDVVVSLGLGDGSLLVGLELGACVGLELGDWVGLDVGSDDEEVLSVGLALGSELDGDGSSARAVSASTAAPVGMELHAALAIGPTGVTGGLLSTAAIAWPATLTERKAKPVRTPTTAGLTTSCALTPDLASCWC